jgi:hypothetical protein
LLSLILETEEKTRYTIGKIIHLQGGDDNIPAVQKYRKQGGRKMSKNKSFSLLNQEEIDTLVRFLTDKKNAVDSDVMSQTSIDKLIQLIRTDKERLVLNQSLSREYTGDSILKRLPFRKKHSEPCVLRCNINPETNFIELSIYNTVQDAAYQLTPNIFDENDDASWGYAIPPAYFSQIAYSLSLKYTQESYDFVCSTFAKITYGSENHKISEVYLPDNEALVDSIL